VAVRQGDSGEQVKTLQRDLNKFGAMLTVDGRFGSSTADAIGDARALVGQPGPPEADDQLLATLAAAPDLFPPLTSAGVTFIARAEVTSPTAYRRKYQRPTWPSSGSGITIGIGYDCQFTDATKFHADWDALLPSQTITQLVPILGSVGSFDRLNSVQGVVVPLNAAITVFAKKSLGRCLDDTRTIYPQVDTLDPSKRTALTSLVYNRGTRLTDNDPQRQERREMRAIQDLLAAGQIDQIADQFDKMARLWDPDTLGGLVARRHDEATLWRSGFAALQLA
jgi:GH24 family phage-related lysozyme (muramidase)